MIISEPETENEADVLHYIHETPRVRQRDLAHVLGMSLGNINIILKRLAERGLVAIAKVNNRNISYMLTENGIKALAGRSFRYLKRTVKTVVDCKEALHLAIYQACVDQSIQEIVLVGQSELGFLVEHEAMLHRCRYYQVEIDSLSHCQGQLVVYAEDVLEIPSGAIGLRSVLEACSGI
jgi:DNA-binding MarR family transcriptional regulator